MPQQINLHHPVLLAPQRHLRARTIAMALGVWALALLGLGGWSLWRTQSMRTELASTTGHLASQKTQLTRARAARQAALGSPAALKEEAARLASRLDERRHLLGLLEGGDASRSPTVLLRELADEVPAQVWLTEIRWTPAQVELAGRTLQPEALQAWMARRGATHTLRVEQGSEPAAADTGRTTSATSATGPSGAWSFRWRQSLAGAAPAAAPAQPASASAVAIASKEKP